MTAQPDIIWNEQCLGIRIGEQVCTYLKKHDAEYQRLQKKILELTEKYPVIETFMESNQSISLTEEEHKAVHRYFQLESEKEMIEEEYHFYMGQAQMISYGAMLGKIKKAKMCIRDSRATAKSPQQMFGALAKSYFAEKIGVDPKRIFVVSIMPCTAKKSEAALPRCV